MLQQKLRVVITDTKEYGLVLSEALGSSFKLNRVDAWLYRKGMRSVEQLAFKYRRSGAMGQIEHLRVHLGFNPFTNNLTLFEDET